MSVESDRSPQDFPNLDALASALVRVLLSAWRAREARGSMPSAVADKYPESVPTRARGGQ